MPTEEEMEVNKIIAEKAKEILFDPSVKSMIKRLKTYSIYLEDKEIGVQISITIPKK